MESWSAELEDTIPSRDISELSKTDVWVGGVAQSVESLPSVHEARGLISSPADVMLHICKPSAWEVQAGDHRFTVTYSSTVNLRPA